MTLTTPRGFAGGPMADIDYGIGAAGGYGCEAPGDLYVTQPNAGTRTVSIAAGTASAFGVRVTNDAALPQILSAPSSGGAWFYLALRFNWNSKTVSLQTIAGPTTGGTTAPTKIPDTLPSVAGTPGVAFDLPLTWAFVSSANTTVTLFDTRLLRTGAPALMAATVWAALVAQMTTVLRPGARLELGQHTPNGISFGIARATLVMADNGKLQMVPGTVLATFNESGPLGVRTMAAAVSGVLSSFPSQWQWTEGDIIRCFSGEARYTIVNGARWLLWNVYNLPVQTFITLQQDVVFDDNGGLSAADVINGVLHLALSLYTNNVRSAGDGWAQIPTLRPRLRVIAGGRAYSGVDNGAEGIANLQIVSDGTLSIHRFANPGPQRANAWSGTVVYPIDQ